METSSKPQITRIAQKTDKDCARCCIAMILDLPYDQVPDFVDAYGKMWARELNTWLLLRGYELLITKGGAQYVPAWLPVMATFDSTETKPGHCCVVTKTDIIDPHDPPKELRECAAIYAFLRIPDSPTSCGTGERFASGIAETLEEPKPKWRLIDGNMLYKGDEFIALIHRGKPQRLCDELSALSSPAAQQQEWSYYETHHGWFIYRGGTCENRIAIVGSEAAATNICKAHNTSIKLLPNKAGSGEAKE